MREGGGRAKGKGASTLQQEERERVDSESGGRNALSPTPAAPVPVTTDEYIPNLCRP